MHIHPFSFDLVGFATMAARLIAKPSIAFCMLFIPASLATAQVDTAWITTDGNWSDAANWDNGVPDGGFTAIFESNTGTVNQDINGLAIFGFDLSSNNANIILNESIDVVGTMLWESGTISGNGEFNFFGNGEAFEVELGTTFNNHGTMQLGSADFFANLMTDKNAIWNNLPGSLLELRGVLGNVPNGMEGSLNNSHGARIHFQSSATYIFLDTHNDGLIEVNNNTIALFVRDYSQSETAHLKLNGGTVDFFEDVVMLGRVSGNGGMLNLSSTFEAQLEPGGDEIGMIEFGGALPMTANAVTKMQIGPNFTADRIHNLGGGLQLDGTLDVEALPGATPGTYTLFSYNNGFGLQIDIQLGQVPSGFQGQLVHDTTNMSINLEVDKLDEVFPLGDVNRDGVVNLLDVQPFIDLLNTGQFQLEADINGDGNVNLLDVDLFVQILGA